MAVQFPTAALAKKTMTSSTAEFSNVVPTDIIPPSAGTDFLGYDFGFMQNWSDPSLLGSGLHQVSNPVLFAHIGL